MMFSHWVHKIGALLGSALAILPVLGMIPGAGPTLNVITTVVGVGITLATNLEKVVGGAPATGVGDP